MPIRQKLAKIAAIAGIALTSHAANAAESKVVGTAVNPADNSVTTFVINNSGNLNGVQTGFARILYCDTGETVTSSGYGVASSGFPRQEQLKVLADQCRKYNLTPKFQ